MDGKKVWKKTGFGVLFVAACFAAMYILVKFNGNVIMVFLAAVVLLVTAFLFLNEIFSEKSKKWMQEGTEPEAIKETVSSGTDGEFRLKIAKHMKEMESTQKELIDVLKNQNALLQSQMENMEQAIFTLSDKQANQAKSVIKFNKENARQLAISERETLEYVMVELKKAIEDNAGAVGVRMPSVEAVATESMEEQVPEVLVTDEPEAEISTLPMEEVSNEELFEVSDLPGDEEYTIPDIPVVEEPVLEESVLEEPVEEFLAEDLLVEEPLVEEPLVEELLVEEPFIEEPSIEELEIPDMPDDIDLSALFEDMAASALEENTEEPLPDFPTLENLPIPEDIVPLEEAAEPAPAEEPAADPLAGLSGDPNAMMTPEDIAKLLASMGQ